MPPLGLEINTNKSYKRHNHWKGLCTDDHAAKLCLVKCINHFIDNELRGNPSINWDFFLTALDVIPKNGKKDYSSKNAWRPISIGSSENWIFEKILLSRLQPFLQTKDCQFGYKRNHIEIIRCHRNYSFYRTQA